MIQAISQEKYNQIISGANQSQKATIEAAKKVGNIAISPTTQQIQPVQNGGISHDNTPQALAKIPNANTPTVTPYSGNNNTQNPITQQIPQVTPMANPMNNYSYGQAASDLAVKTPTYLDTRNNDLATYFKNQGVTDSAGIQKALMANQQYSGAHAFDQQTTAQAIADKIAAQQKDLEAAGNAQALKEQKSINDQTLSSVQDTNKFNMQEGIDSTMSDIQRADILAKRQEQTNTDSYNRNVQLADRNVEQARIQTNNNIADVSEQANKQIQAAQMSGALTGTNMSSAFTAGINQIHTDAQKIIDRLGTSENQLVDWTAEDKQYLLTQRSQNQDKIQQDWAYQMRQFTDQMQTDIKMGTDKYKISDPKLATYLNEKVVKPFQTASFQALKSWQDANQANNDNAFKNLENIYKLNTLSQDVNKHTIDQLNANGGAALQYMTVDDINHLVSQGNLSTTDAAIMKTNMVAGAVKGLEQYGMPNQQDIQSIQQAISGGSTPGEAMGRVISQNPGRFDINKGFKPNIQTVQNSDGSQSSVYFDSNGVMHTVSSSATDNNSYTPVEIAPVDQTKVDSTVKSYTISTPVGSVGGECGAYVNKYLNSMGISGNIFTDPINAKTAYVNSTTPKKGDVVVLDYGITVPDGKGGMINAGHTGIVTDVNNGQVTVQDSNYTPGSHTVSSHTLTADEMGKVKGYFDPSIGIKKQTGNEDLNKLAEYLIDTQPRGAGFSDNDVQAYTKAIQKYAKAGDKETVFQLYRNQILKDKSNNTIYDNATFIRDNIDQVKGWMEEYKKNGGNMNIFNGTIQNIQQKLGKSGNDLLLKINQGLGLLTADYIRSISGTASSDKEVQRLIGLLPKITDNFDKGMILSDGFRNRIVQQTQNALENTMGKNKGMVFDIFPELKGDAKNAEGNNDNPEGLE